jgi:hypothetical protein
MLDYDLPSGDHRVRFTGTILAQKSSKQGRDDLRWTEIEIYRTAAGNYIVHKVGRSVVVHKPDRDCTSGEPYNYRTFDAGVHACPRCVPDLSQVVPLAPRLFRETDRHTVHVSETARGAVESCYTQDGDRVAYLTFPARSALHEAAQQDSDIRDAFLVQRVD